MLKSEGGFLNYYYYYFYFLISLIVAFDYREEISQHTEFLESYWNTANQDFF